MSLTALYIFVSTTSPLRKRNLKPLFGNPEDGVAAPKHFEKFEAVYCPMYLAFVPIIRQPLLRGRECIEKM